MDVLSASVLDGKIAWYKNDGRQNFTSRVITTTAGEALSVHAADVDGDGDWMCSLPQTMMTKSLGMKTTASSISAVIASPPL
jgi:hypothetical protein